MGCNGLQAASYKSQDSWDSRPGTNADTLESASAVETW
jgi:hypothetical protein